MWSRSLTRMARLEFRLRGNGTKGETYDNEFIKFRCNVDWRYPPEGAFLSPLSSTSRLLCCRYCNFSVGTYRFCVARKEELLRSVLYNIFSPTRRCHLRRLREHGMCYRRRSGGTSCGRPRRRQFVHPWRQALIAWRHFAVFRYSSSRWLFYSFYSPPLRSSSSRAPQILASTRTYPTLDPYLT